MKSYSQYRNEESEKKQLKIDKMKPEVRWDYFNRYDRLEEHFKSKENICLAISKVAMQFGFFLIMFAVLLHSLNTENSLYWFLETLEIGFNLILICIIFLPLSLIECSIKNKKLTEQLNKLDEKYNL